MFTKMIETIVMAAAGLVILNGLMFLYQPSMVFFPYREMSQTPMDRGLAYEDVDFMTTDGVGLHGWYVPAPGSDQVLLFFHGNAGNISHRGDSIAIFHRLGLNVFIIDYRGYGRSGGKPDEQGFYLDADAAWRYLTEVRGVAGKDIVIFGRSLGGAVAAQLAARVRPGGLILESTFDSARAVAKAVFPLLSRLVLTRFGFSTAQYLKAVTCPVLVMHSPEDEIIPFSLGEKVFQAANEPRTFVKMEGSHNLGFLQSQPGYALALERFIRGGKDDPLPGT